jgi:hypothetical protein
MRRMRAAEAGEGRRRVVSLKRGGDRACGDDYGCGSGLAAVGLYCW